MAFLCPLLCSRVLWYHKLSCMGCCIFFGLRWRSPPPLPGVYTIWHNDPAAPQDHWGRCRIRTRDFCLRSLARYHWATTSHYMLWCDERCCWVWMVSYAVLYTGCCGVMRGAVGCCGIISCAVGCRGCDERCCWVLWYHEILCRANWATAANGGRGAVETRTMVYTKY